MSHIAGRAVDFTASIAGSYVGDGAPLKTISPGFGADDSVISVSLYPAAPGPSMHAVKSMMPPGAAHVEGVGPVGPLVSFSGADFAVTGAANALGVTFYYVAHAQLR